MKFWTPEETDALIKIVKSASSRDEAVDLVAKAFPKDNITYETVAKRLKRVGAPTITQLVAPNRKDVERPKKTEREQVDDDLQKHKLQRQVAELTAAKNRLVEELIDQTARFDALRALKSASPATVAKHKARSGKQRQGVPVLVCSDWHVEEPVVSAKVNGLNEYNLEIADRCVNEMAEAFEWLTLDSRYDCRTGVVWLGGDLFSGYIHEELVEGNFLSPVEAVIWLQERIERMLRKIAASTKLDRIMVVCNDGNHGRMTNKIRVSTRTANSLEWLLYQTIAGRLRDDPRFEFQVADGEWSFVDLYGKTYAFTHGDSFRYQGGVGGISIPLRRGINEMRKYRPIHHTTMGHFHQRSDFGDITVNGSMIGTNPYSMRIHAPPEPRQQTFFLVDSERGKAISAPVWLPQR